MESIRGMLPSFLLLQSDNTRTGARTSMCDTIRVLDVVSRYEYVRRVAIRRHVLRVTYMTLLGVDEPTHVSDEQFDTAAEAFQVVQSFPRSPARSALSWYCYSRCFFISRVSTFYGLYCISILLYCAFTLSVLYNTTY